MLNMDERYRNDKESVRSPDKTQSGYGKRVNVYRSQNQPSRKREAAYDPVRARKELQYKKDEAKLERMLLREQKKERMRILRTRAVLIVLTVIILAVLLMFMTPIFNISRITVQGNQVVSADDVNARLSDIKGLNLFSVSDSDISDRLKDIAYIDGISVAKYLIPPTLKITVNEYKPSGVLILNGKDVIIDNNMRVVSDNGGVSSEGVPEIRGLDIKKYTVGDVLVSEDAEKDEIINICIDVMRQVGMLDKTDYIDVSDKTNITFGYDDRIDAFCGTKLDLERKIRMFYVAVTSNNLAENARGTMDLSTSGKAIYTP